MLTHSTRLGHVIVALAIACLGTSAALAEALPLIADNAGQALMSAAGPPAQGLLCRGAIAGAEAALRIPDMFLSAIGRVESGRAVPETGQVTPWPWTVDAEGQGSFYPTKAAAIAAVQALQARGVRSIDVGCLQVNLQQHPEAFGSLDQAFDPQANANFAARLLASLFAQTGSWPLAAAAYHSQTPAVGAPYQQRVLAAWAMPDRPAAPKPPAPAAKQKPVAADAPAMGGAMAAGGGGGPVTVFNRSVRAAPDPSAPQGFGLHGRGLDAYRQYPVMLAMRVRKAPDSSPTPKF